MLLISLVSVFLPLGMGWPIGIDDVDVIDVPPTHTIAYFTPTKRGVDPMSIPRLIKEPPLKRGDKRADVVYPSAAKHTVPLVRIREPPLKRAQFIIDDIIPSRQDPTVHRIRFLENRPMFFTW